MQRERQLLGAQRCRLRTVGNFITSHLIEDGAATVVGGRQAVLRAPQMSLHLPFGLREEAEARGVADCAGQGADGKRSRIPERIQYAGSAVEFAESLLAPGKMIHLFQGGP